MSLTVPNLARIRAIPVIGKYLYEALNGVQGGINQMAVQGNLNPSGTIPPPPNINSFRMTNGPSGEHQFEINDTGAFGRGNNYFVDYDTSPNFTNPHTFPMGQSRNGHVNLPGQTLYARARSAYPSGESSDWVYHGSPVNPLPVTGGITGARAPSQGSGTGAPRTGGGPGPVQVRNQDNSYNWTLQQPEQPTTPSGNG